MIISIHQPEHLPWTVFFKKIACCNKFILLDNVQFKKNNVQNRNRLLDTSGDTYWATVPTNNASSKTLIIDKEIATTVDWRDGYLRKIHESYSSTPFFRELFGEFEDIINLQHLTICTLNIDIILWVLRKLSINTEIILASELDVTGHKSSLLVNLCKAVNATTYISGSGGKDYLDTSEFIANKITVEFKDLKPSVYALEHKIKNLSILDFIFRHGPEVVAQEIKGKRKVLA